MTQSWVAWPRYVASESGLDLNGHTNGLPDFVGPIDGSARLTIFTEGNHFPVLLPLVLEAFPAWCAAECGLEVQADELLVVMLPQVMVVQALTSGRITLGNAVLPIGPGGVYPDVVMGGDGPLTRLAEAGVVRPRATRFAKHRGMGLLVRNDLKGPVDSLEALSGEARGGSGSAIRVVVATPNEAGARRQYRATLEALVGETTADAIFAREVPTFPGRLGIQHRDVPYALLTDQADVGLIFGHLAHFYAEAFPEMLSAVTVEAAAPFGQRISFVRVREAEGLLVECFERFLLEQARTYYPQRGFAGAETFDYGVGVELGE
ncbi:MAG: substrate-binding domain-containing protein [Planctomycetota bacterium]